MLWIIAYTGAGLSAITAAGYAMTTTEQGWPAYIAAITFGFVALLGSHGWMIGARVARRGHPVVGTIAGIFFTACAVVTLAAGMGMFSTRSAKTDNAASKQRQEYAALRASLTRAQAARDQLPVIRPEAVIDADIKATKRDRLYDATSKCLLVTSTQGRDLCAKLDRLEGEKANTAEAARLDGIIAAQTGKLEGYGPDAYSHDSSRVSALTALLNAMPGVKINSETTEAFFAFCFSVALELGSMFAMLCAELTTNRPHPSAASTRPTGWRALWSRPSNPAFTAPPRLDSLEAARTHAPVLDPQPTLAVPTHYTAQAETDPAPALDPLPTPLSATAQPYTTQPDPEPAPTATALTTSERSPMVRSKPKRPKASAPEILSPEVNLTTLHLLPFLRDRASVDPAGQERAQAVYQAYIEWAQANDLEPLALRDFARTVAEVAARAGLAAYDDQNSVRYITGLRLLPKAA